MIIYRRLLPQEQINEPGKKRMPPVFTFGSKKVDAQ